MIRIPLAAVLASLALSPSLAQEASVEEGARIAIIGGCHDCHTDGYAASGGKVDPALALLGSPVGFKGPWGTTYAANLRLTLSKMSEDDFVKYGHSFQARPPMPWFNIHAMTDGELRSFYLYVKSLGETGMPAPAYVEPGAMPVTPFIVLEPQMPAN